MRKFDRLRAPVLERPGAAERIAAYEAGMLREMSLAELRQARELTQKALAEELRTTQSSISRIENQTDLYVSTLRKYVEAVGGQLQITAVFPEGSLAIRAFSDSDSSAITQPVPSEAVKTS